MKITRLEAKGYIEAYNKKFETESKYILVEELNNLRITAPMSYPDAKMFDKVQKKASERAEELIKALRQDKPEQERSTEEILSSIDEHYFK